MEGIVYIPHNWLGGYRAALQLVRGQSGYRAYFRGYRYEGGQHVLVDRGGIFDDLVYLLDARAGHFPVYVGSVKLESVEGDEVRFVKNGVLMSLGEVVDFLNSRDFKRIQ